MKKNKALTSYPVFLLTLASIITLTILTIHLVDTTIQTIQDTIEEINNEPWITYRKINNQIYLETNAQPPVNETIKTINTTTTIILRQINQNLYGPLKLPRSKSIIIITGYYHDKPVIIDALTTLPGPLNIKESVKGLWPPSILVDMGENTIQPILQTNPNKTYIVLKPVITTTKHYITNNTLYKTTIYGDLEKTNTSKWISLGNITIPEENITNVARKEALNYGRIKLSVKIPLKLTLEKTYSIIPKQIVPYNESSKPLIILKATIDLGEIAINNTRTLHVALNMQCLSIIVRDLTGRQYRTNTTFESVLTAYSVVNGTFSKVYMLRKNIGSNTTGLFKIQKAFTANNTLHLSLQIRLLIKVIQPILAPRLISSATIHVEPGYSSSVYLKQYIPDKLVLNSNNSSLSLIPLNNEVLNTHIYHELGMKWFLVVVNNSRTYNLSSLIYNPVEPINLTYNLLVYPSTIVENTTNTVIKTRRWSLIYPLPEGYGIYYKGRDNILIITTYPLIVINNSLRKIIRSSNVNVIIINNNNTNKELYITESNNYEFFNGKNIEYYNFAVIQTIGYRKPVIIINNSMNQSMNIIIKYIDGSKQILEVADSGIINNKPIIEIILVIQGYGNNTIMYFPARSNTIIIYNRGNLQVQSLDAVKPAKILGTPVYPVYAENTTILIPDYSINSNQ